MNIYLYYIANHAIKDLKNIDSNSLSINDAHNQTQENGDKNLP